MRTGFLQQKAAKPCRLTFRFQVQVPTAVTELAQSVYYFSIPYKLSDDGVSKLCFVVITRSAIRISRRTNSRRQYFKL